MSWSHYPLQLILDNELPLSSVSESIGISSMPYFIRVFKYFFGITPKQFSIYFRE
ncbi:AraC family transcriptional regulator [Escherichia coli]|uniref:AraC family transcriptional regulator n=1 Tax=Escherichia coli TaxID=562 RepID=UPI0011E85DFC